MNEMEAKKLLKGPKKDILTSIGLFILGIILIFVGVALEPSTEGIEATDYDTLIGNKADKEDAYAKVTIAYLPYLFAEETGEYGNKNYYIIFDKKGYPYIARLTDETYQKLEKLYDEGLEISYELKGYLFNQDAELKPLAINAHRKMFEDSEISEANYEMFFGKTYIDEVAKASSAGEIIFLTIGIVLSIIGVICFIVAVIAKIRFKSVLRKANKDDLLYELAKDSTMYFKKEEICLTDNYIISTFLGLNILKYDDIVWTYYEDRRYNFVSIGKYLIARTKNKKAYQIAYTFRNVDLLVEIMNKIHDKNDKVMVGFTKENQQAYKELTKKKKD